MTKKTQGTETNAYGYPSQPPLVTNQIIKRPITESDMELFSKFYQNSQKRLRVLAVLSFGLPFINYIILSDIIMDWTISFILYLCMIIIGAVSIGMSLNVILIRKKLSNTLKEGTVIEVSGPAYRNRMAPNSTAWTVGPISIMSSLAAGPLSMMQEGAQATIVCIPQMRIAFSINNVGLKYGARIISPPNLEALVTLEQILPQEEEQEEEVKTIEGAVDKALRSDERLTRLKELKDKGLITQKDYENKKKEILIEI